MKEQMTNAAMGKLSSLEDRLSDLFKPVLPRQEFVHGLGNRIHVASRAVFVDRVAQIHMLAVLTAGLISLGVLLVVLVRSVLKVTGRRTPTAG